MISYDFYKNVYLGTAISEVAFPHAIARGEEWVAKLERTCQVEPYGPDSRAMAVCSVAETMEYHRKHQQIVQASIGGVTVRYEDDRKLQRQLWRNVAVFLDIKRGVG